MGNWQFASAHTKGKRPRPPEPIQRPGVKPRCERHFGKPQPVAEIRERLRALNGR